MNHILFLTTNNLASNPRLTKELNLALSIGYTATVLAFVIGNWSDEASKEISNKLQNNHKDSFELIELDATTSTWFPWFFWGLLEKISKKIYPFFQNNVFVNALATTRRSIQLLREAKKMAIPPDLILAHNMGALYPAYCLGKTYKVPFIFDVEDYHPGEMPTSDKDNERKRRKYLLSKLLPHAKAITSASPLIGKYTLDLIGGHLKHFIILNSFPESEFISPLTQKHKIEEPLKLIWFGQKIGPGRGLEELFLAVIDISRMDSEPICLVLIGDWDEMFKNKVFLPLQKAIQDTSISVEVLPPMVQVELHVQLGQNDIGLALEQAGTDLNRQLCLTNKIIACAQAGLYILATNTMAQTEFINESQNRGMLCGQSSLEIRLALKKLLLDRKAISQGRKTRYNNSKKLAWEVESNKLVNLWTSALNK